MSKLIVTNIRLPKEDLQEYRLIALQEGKSFSAYLRKVIAEFAKHWWSYDLDNQFTRQHCVTGFVKDGIAVRVNRG